jgi:hypothetical protein
MYNIKKEFKLRELEKILDSETEFPNNNIPEQISEDSDNFWYSYSYDPKTNKAYFEMKK